MHITQLLSVDPFCAPMCIYQQLYVSLCLFGFNCYMQKLCMCVLHVFQLILRVPMHEHICTVYCVCYMCEYLFHPDGQVAGMGPRCPQVH